MESRQKNLNSFWGHLLVEELVRNNITCFCISPGSRSTPLTIAAAENPRAKKVICLDERGAAFYALGYGRATGKAAAVICTSGTAAANFYPAVIEARQSHIPLIVLTADRPPELRDTGVNQTIDQVKIYGDYPNWQFDLPCPDIKIPPEMVMTTIDQAVHRSHSLPAGPVHLNCMFRKPLEPSERRLSKSYINKVKKWLKSGTPLTNYKKTHQIPDDTDLKTLAHLINKTKKGILIVGQLPDNYTKDVVMELIQKLRWPVFADIASGIRHRKTVDSLVQYFDQMLLADKIRKTLKPAIVLHLGKPLTSKRYLQFVKKYPPWEYIQVVESNDRNDPGHIVTQRFSCAIHDFCTRMSKYVEGKTDKQWYIRISEFDKRVEQISDKNNELDSKVTEISLARIISRNLGEDQGLFLASSMPVRDFDMYAGLIPSSLNIASNRGASGIDGTLASAAGFANGLNKPTTVVLGDLALIHDMNSMSLIDASEIPLTVVVINNNGGGIFSFLPVAEFKHVFEKYFTTPHNYNFGRTAEMFNINYYQPVTNGDFLQIYQSCTSGNKSSLIEIITNRDENFKLHQDIQFKIKSALEK